MLACSAFLVTRISYTYMYVSGCTALIVGLAYGARDLKSRRESNLQIKSSTLFGARPQASERARNQIIE